jgi:hypothetical protein
LYVVTTVAEETTELAGRGELLRVRAVVHLAATEVLLAESVELEVTLHALHPSLGERQRDLLVDVVGGPDAQSAASEALDTGDVEAVGAEADDEVGSFEVAGDGLDFVVVVRMKPFVACVVESDCGRSTLP